MEMIAAHALAPSSIYILSLSLKDRARKQYRGTAPRRRALAVFEPLALRAQDARFEAEIQRSWKGRSVCVDEKTIFFYLPLTFVRF